MGKIALNFNKNGENLQKSKKFLQIDFSFIFIFCIAILIGEFRFYFWYILCLIGHEFSHFFVAKKLGYYSKKIKLNFFGAVLEGDDDFLLKDEIKIVLAGPIFNFCLIIFCYLSFWFEPECYEYLNEVLLANLSILIFNLLPVFPLDCGRLVLLIFSLKRNRIRALKSARIVSLIFIVLLFGLFILSSFYSFNIALGLSAINLMSLYLSNSNDTSYKRQLFVDRKFKLLERGLLERTIYVRKDFKLYSLFKFIDDNHFINFIFLDSKLNQVDKLSEVEFYKKMNLL